MLYMELGGSKNELDSYSVSKSDKGKAPSRGSKGKGKGKEVNQASVFEIKVFGLSRYRELADPLSLSLVASFFDPKNLKSEKHFEENISEVDYEY